MPITREPAQGYTYQGITIPPAIAADLDLWIDHGKLHTGFLQALLCNDLRDTFSQASASSRLAIHAILIYLYNEAPGGCHGSPEKVKAWAARFVTPARTRPKQKPHDAGLEPTTDNHEADTENSLEAPERGLLSNLPHDA